MSWAFSFALQGLFSFNVVSAFNRASFYFKQNSFTLSALFSHLQVLTEQADKRDLNDAYHQKLAENERLAEERTAKKRAKRLKKKQNKKPKKGQKKESSSSEEEDEEEEEKEADGSERQQEVEAVEETKAEQKPEESKEAEEK